jgi:hypothetical protein
MSVSTSRLPSRPSLGRSLTRPAKRIAASVKAETAAAGGPRAGIPQGRPPGLFSQGKLRRLPPAVRTRAGAWPRQLADDGAFPDRECGPVKLRGSGRTRRRIRRRFRRSSPRPPRNLKAGVESHLRDNGPSTTVQIVAALDSTPNRVCGALGNANVECEDGRYRLADDA